MKKSISILLVLLLFFNVIGFYGLFFGIGYHNRLTLINRFDNNHYNSTETITFKIPIVIPYYSDQDDFERVDGEFEHNGEFYRLVKQRLARDTLYIVCIKDHESKKIHQALTDYLKVITDKSTNDKQSTELTFSIIKDYYSSTFSMGVKSLGWAYNIEWQRTSLEFRSSFFPSINLPPQRA